MNPVVRLAEAVNGGDFDGVASVFHPDFEVHRPSGGGFKGRDQEVKNMQSFMSNYPEGRMEIVHMIETPSEVWVENRFTTEDSDMGAIVAFRVHPETETIIGMRYLMSRSRRLR